MDSYSQNSSKMSEDEHLYSRPKEIEELSRLKMEAFHLRLRCYNLEQQLINCKCSMDQDEDQKEFFDHRTQLNNVVNSHQELKWAKEQLEEDNRLLKEKCSIINDDFEKKLTSYDSLKEKYEQLGRLIEQDSSVPSVVTKIMKDNDDLIQTNIERKLKIRHLEKKMAEMNNSFVEDEVLRRQSLTKSFVKMFKGSNESSFQNTSNLAKQCFQCDELKVYNDQLSETVIKMTIDFQGLTKAMEQKNNQIADLEQQIITLNSMPNIDEEQLKKYKVIAKQCMRKYLQEKESREKQIKEYDQLIEFYIKQQGEIQLELETVRKQGNSSNSRIIDETNKIGELFVKKLSEVQETNDQMCQIMKTINLSQDSLSEVGQRNPQSKIRTDFLGNSSMCNEADSVFYDKNVSLNATMFKSRADDSFLYEANLNEVIEAMQRKVRELGEVVQSYMVKMTNEHTGSVCSKKDISCLAGSGDVCSPNTSVWTFEKTENNDSEFSIRDGFNLKRIYEEEKQRFDHLLNEHTLKNDELMIEIEKLQQRKRETDVTIEDLSAQYTTAVSKYHYKIKQLKDEIKILEDAKHDDTEYIRELENSKKILEDQMAEERKVFDDRFVELERETDKMVAENFKVKETVLLSDKKFERKVAEMEMIFNKVKSMIEDHSILFPLYSIDKDSHDMGIEYFCTMLDTVEIYLKGKNIDTSSKSLSIPDGNDTKDSLDLEQSLEQSLNDLKNSENRFYTSSLNLRNPDSVSHRSESHLHDLTNVSESKEGQLPEIPKINEEQVEDKFKYIRENPEKIHKKMKYFYETCVTLKSAALREHEENKKLKSTYSISLCKAIDEWTKKIDDFKRQLDMCRECLVRSQSSLPDAVAKELKELNLL